MPRPSGHLRCHQLLVSVIPPAVPMKCLRSISSPQEVCQHSSVVNLTEHSYCSSLFTLPDSPHIFSRILVGVQCKEPLQELSRLWNVIEEFQLVVKRNWWLIRSQNPAQWFITLPGKILQLWEGSRVIISTCFCPRPNNNNVEYGYIVTEDIQYQVYRCGFFQVSKKTLRFKAGLQSCWKGHYHTAVLFSTKITLLRWSFSEISSMLYMIYVLMLWLTVQWSDRVISCLS